MEEMKCLSYMNKLRKFKKSQLTNHLKIWVQNRGKNKTADYGVLQQSGVNVLHIT